jgi:predicted hotdog family 3-hydroxylacyl-ACP dehydratase
MIATISVPATAGYFEGHFPGRPILPGVVELVLLLEALARETGNPAPLREIGFVRLRQLVLPGDRLELATRELDDGRIRFDLKREQVLVANGELVLGPPRQAHVARATGQASTNPVVAAPTMEQLLPHRPPMCFVTSILSETPDGLTCAGRIPAGFPLVYSNSVPALVALEVAAQAAAAWEGLLRWRERGEAAPRIGYLVALRAVTFFTERFPADRVLSANVHLEATAASLNHYRVDVSLDDISIVQGTVATFLGV